MRVPRLLWWLGAAALVSGVVGRVRRVDLAPERAALWQAAAEPSEPSRCDPSYPTVCIPPPPPDLDCSDLSVSRFPVRGADPHGFDADHDGIGCEGASKLR